MSLEDLIFPPGPPRDGHILRLDLVSTWESQLLGVSRATAFLTPRLLSQSHAVDDIGLYVVFLARHRVELGLKLILERSTTTILPTHRIAPLFAACETACSAAGYRSSWDRFASRQSEFVALMDAADEGSATFRYPVDPSMRPWPRKGHVDLVALEDAGSRFGSDVRTLITDLADLESLPVGEDEAQAAAHDLAAFIRASRNFTVANAEATRRIQKRSDDLLGVKRTRDVRQADAYSAAAAVSELTEALRSRAEDMLARITAGFEIEVPPEEPTGPVREMPPLRIGPDLAQMAAQLEAQERWYVDEFVRVARPLNRAVDALYRRTKSWEGHAAIPAPSRRRAVPVAAAERRGAGGRITNGADAPRRHRTEQVFPC